MTEHSVHLLIVEDDPGQARLLARPFDAEATVSVTVAESLAAARERIAETTPAVVLADLVLHDGRGVDLIPEEETERRFPVVVMTAQGDEEAAVDAMHAGALDYVVKSPAAFRQLPHTVSRALREWNLRLEKRQQEETLRDREARLESIFRAAPTGIGVVADRMLLEVNDRICEMTGRTREELVGESARVLYPTDEDYNYVGEEKYRQIQGRGTGTVETRWQRKDGAIIDVLLSSTPLEPDDLSKGVTFTALDITERRLAQQALEQSQRNWETTFDAMSDWVCLLDADHRVLQCNAAGEALVGVSPEAARGRVCCELLHRSKQPIADCPMVRALETGQKQRTEMQLTGTDRWVVVTVDPVRDADGQITGGVHVVRDLTERKRAEEALQESEERLRSIAEASPDYIMMLDTDLRVRYLNRPEQGLTLADVLGQPLPSLAPEDQRDVVRDSLETTRDTGEPTRYETSYERPEGTTVFFESRVAALKADDEVHGLTVVSRDLTERKRAEALTAAFAHLGHELSTADSVEAAAQTVVDAADRLLGWDACHVRLVERGTDLLQPVLYLDEIEGQRTRVQGETTPMEPTEFQKGVMADGGRLLLRDEEELAPPPPNVRMFGDKTRPSASLMFVPIRHGDEAVGLLSIQSYTLRAYTETDLDTLQALADHCGGALARVRAQEALREREEKYRGIFDDSVAAIYVFDADKNFLDSNQAGLDLLGYTKEELLSMSIPEVDADPEAVLPAHRQLLAGQKIVGYEHRLRRKDGKFITVLNNSRPLFDAQGSVVGMQSTLVDITERKAAEDALRQSHDAEQRTAELLAELNKVTNELSACETFDDLCRRAIELGHARLGYDRLALWFRGNEPATVVGSFGIDEKGGTRDERDQQIGVSEGSPMWRVLEGGERLVRVDETPLLNHRAEVVGQGTQVLTGLWDGEQILGCLSVDNLLSQRTFNDRECGLVSLFGSALGHLCTRMRAEEQVRARNRELAVLHDSSQAITSSLDLQQVLREIVRQAHNVLDASHSTVVLVDDDGNLGESFEEFVGAEPLAVRARPDGVTSRILNASQPVGFEDVQPGPDHNPAILQAGIRSYVGVPLLVEGRTVGVLYVHSTQPAAFSDRLELISTLANHAAVAVDNARMYEQLVSAHSQLETMSRKLVEVQEAERRHLARELHDDLGQTMTLVRVALQKAQSCVASGAAHASLSAAIETVDGAIKQVRSLSLDLRPSMLDDLGLVPTLRWYLNSRVAEAGVSVSLEATPEDPAVSPELAIVCFRVAQEALTNIIRHAEATEARLELHQTESELQLVIRDNGVGFNVEDARKRSAIGGSFGLTGMRERVHLAGGRIELESRPGEGTEIRVSF